MLRKYLTFASLTLMLILSACSNDAGAEDQLVKQTVDVANTEQALLLAELETDEAISPTSEALVVPSETAVISSPTPEPLPQQIAFASDRNERAQLWIVNMDGSDERQLTQIEEGACQPTWSPDGSRIAFTSPCLANRIAYPGSAIYIYEMETGDVSQITEGDAGDYDPSWSPDNTQIAFTSLRLGNRSKLFFYNLDSEVVTSFSPEDSYEYQPAWSANGKRLAYVTTAYGPELVFTTEIENPDRELFLSESYTDGKYVSAPLWAPDGSGIFYVLTSLSGSIPQIYFVPAPGNPTRHQALFDIPIAARDPSLSPDEQWIAAEMWPNTTNHDIWIFTLDGENQTRITTDEANDFDPAWRP
jgi:Tol biopolymer transport system component